MGCWDRLRTSVSEWLDVVVIVVVDREFQIDGAHLGIELPRLANERHRVSQRSRGC